MSDRLDVQWVIDLIERIDAASRADDVEAMLALFTDDVVIDDGTPVVGRTAVAELLTALYKEGELVQVVSDPVFLSLDGTEAAVRREFVVRRPGVEGTLPLSVFNTFRFADGLIARWTTYVRDTRWLDRVTS